MLNIFFSYFKCSIFFSFFEGLPLTQNVWVITSCSMSWVKFLLQQQWQALLSMIYPVLSPTYKLLPIASVVTHIKNGADGTTVSCKNVHTNAVCTLVSTTRCNIVAVKEICLSRVSLYKLTGFMRWLETLWYVTGKYVKDMKGLKY